MQSIYIYVCEHFADVLNLRIVDEQAKQSGGNGVKKLASKDHRIKKKTHQQFQQDKRKEVQIR